MNDLEICKRIAEIEGVEHLCDKGVVVLCENYNELINTICSGRYSPEQVVKFIAKASYNPLTDDALCFKLMVKHKVIMDWERRGVMALITQFKGFPSVGHADSPNKAILLCIIEAHNER